jgi:hypothetical protein
VLDAAFCRGFKELQAFLGNRVEDEDADIGHLSVVICQWAVG